jgi:hypothetical protein
MWTLSGVADEISPDLDGSAGSSPASGILDKVGVEHR